MSLFPDPTKGSQKDEKQFLDMEFGDALDDDNILDDADELFPPYKPEVEVGTIIRKSSTSLFKSVTTGAKIEMIGDVGIDKQIIISLLPIGKKWEKYELITWIGYILTSFTFEMIISLTDVKPGQFLIGGDINIKPTQLLGPDDFKNGDIFKMNHDEQKCIISHKGNRGNVGKIQNKRVFGSVQKSLIFWVKGGNKVHLLIKNFKSERMKVDFRRWRFEKKKYEKKKMFDSPQSLFEYLEM